MTSNDLDFLDDVRREFTRVADRERLAASQNNSRAHRGSSWRTPVIASAVATALAAGVGIAAISGANGDHPTTAPAADSVPTLYEVFRKPQTPEDIFVPSSSHPANLYAGAMIAKTSRLVARDGAADVYAFIKGKDRVCVLYRQADRGVAASGCADPSGSGSAGVSTMPASVNDDSVVVGLVEDGSSPVTVQDGSGNRATIPVTRNAFVYRGKAPFTISWTGHAGTKHRLPVKRIDLDRLKNSILDGPGAPKP